MSAININFLQYSLNTKQNAKTIEYINWDKLYTFGHKHAINGVLLEGIKHLPKGIAPQHHQLLKWLAVGEQIKKQNDLVNRESARLYKKFCKKGFHCCILKGQGNALMYPEPFSRISGDVDIWVVGDKKKIIEFTKQQFSYGHMRFHHVEVNAGNGVTGEVHFFPLYMNNPIYNNRLQRWFNKNGEAQCSNIKNLPNNAGAISVPTTEFNIIYQLGHIFHHFFDEGIGLRQLIDYYYLLLEYTVDDKDKIRNQLKYFGLYKFARAVMYVEKNVLGIDDKYLIVKPDKKRGSLLIEEIRNGGNFGKHYTKYQGFTRKGMVKKYFLKIYRNMHFVKYYPAEALSEPLFRTWHFFWRIYKGYK